MAPAPLLEIKNLRTYFSVRGRTAKAVDDVSLSILPGQTLAWWASPAAQERHRATHVQVTSRPSLHLLRPRSSRAVGRESVLEGQDLCKRLRSSPE